MVSWGVAAWTRCAQSVYSAFAAVSCCFVWATDSTLSRLIEELLLHWWLNLAWGVVKNFSAFEKSLRTFCPCRLLWRPIKPSSQTLSIENHSFSWSSFPNLCPSTWTLMHFLPLSVASIPAAKCLQSEKFRSHAQRFKRPSKTLDCQRHPRFSHSQHYSCDAWHQVYLLRAWSEPSSPQQRRSWSPSEPKLS